MVRATVRIETQLSAGVWTDISGDVVESEPIRLKRGMGGSDPRDRVAIPGTLTFALNNSQRNTGSTQGWYSPNHTSVRSGWTFGIPIRVIATYAAVDYPLWYGRVRS